MCIRDRALELRLGELDADHGDQPFAHVVAAQVLLQVLEEAERLADEMCIRDRGVTKSRNYLQNQVIALGLAIIMVVLGMSSILLNAAARDVLKFLFVHHTDIKVIDFVLSFAYQSTCFVLLAATTAVSYTHLDVYKRQEVSLAATVIGPAARIASHAIVLAGQHVAAGELVGNFPNDRG